MLDLQKCLPPSAIVAIWKLFSPPPDLEIEKEPLFARGVCAKAVLIDSLDEDLPMAGSNFKRTISEMNEKISREEVRHVATLARLELTEEEETRLTEQMNNILNYMDKLNELDTAGISPTTHAIQLQNVFRTDQVLPSLDRKEALANAPRSDGTNFVVPKVF